MYYPHRYLSSYLNYIFVCANYESCCADHPVGPVFGAWMSLRNIYWNELIERRVTYVKTILCNL